MQHPNPIWIASYPRSGNTFLRTILWHCFGLKSSSIYSNDLGGNQALEEYVGHLENGASLDDQLATQSIAPIKTHDLPSDDRKTIYVKRDGRAACVSLWHFYQHAMPLETIIAGHHMFGSWSDHLTQWDPWHRPNTLLLEYQDLIDNLPEILSLVSRFLDIEIISQSVPERNQISSVDGRWVRKKTSWKAHLRGPQLKAFNQQHKKLLKQCGYW